MKIAFLGGGNFGSNLAALLARAGYEVIVGVRDASRTRADRGYRLSSLAEAAEVGELIFVAVPFLACEDVLPALAASLQGKIVVDATNALQADWSPLALGSSSSAAASLRALLPGSRWVKAFNTVFADIMTPAGLNRGGQRVTAFIAGDDAAANATVATLAASAGFAPVITGGLANARYLEAMAHLNIQIAVVNGGGTDAGFVYHQAH